MEIVKDPRVQKIAQEARNTVEYKEEMLFLEITERIVALMEAAKMSKADLARRLGCTPAYITKLLSGSTNFTVNTLLRIGDALDADLRVSLEGSAGVDIDTPFDITELLNLIKCKSKNECAVICIGYKDGVLKGRQRDSWVDVEFNQAAIDKAVEREDYYDKLAIAS